MVNSREMRKKMLTHVVSRQQCEILEFFSHQEEVRVQEAAGATSRPTCRILRSGVTQVKRCMESK